MSKLFSYGINSNEENPMDKKFDLDICSDSGLGYSIEEEGCPVSNQLENLHINCDNDDDKKSNQQLEDFSPLFQQDDDGDSYLHIAICNRDEETALQIINLASSVSQLNLKNRFGQTPVLLSVICQQSNVAKCLIGRGVDLDAVDYTTMNTIVHIAVENRDCLMIESIYSPINWTKSIVNSLTCLKDMKNGEGLTPLHVAVQNQDLESIKVLLHVGADVEVKDGKSGYTALHHAVLTCNVQLVKNFIIICKPFLDSVSYSGTTPYSLATLNGLIDVQRALIDAGASPVLQF